MPSKCPILFSEAFVENELEGIVSKRLDCAYRSDRSRDWLKTKCARFDGERLRYAGAAGTDFSEQRCVTARPHQSDTA